MNLRQDETLDTVIAEFIRKIRVEKLSFTEDERRKHQEKEKTKGAFLIEVSRGLPQTPNTGGSGLQGSPSQPFS